MSLIYLQTIILSLIQGVSEFIPVSSSAHLVIFSDIFKNKGENYFREIEKNISIDYLKLENKIISLGGGGYINQSIRKQCFKNCTTFWLNWKNEILIKRIINRRNIAININYSSYLRLSLIVRCQQQFADLFLLSNDDRFLYVLTLSVPSFLQLQYLVGLLRWS